MGKIPWFWGNVNGILLKSGGNTKSLPAIMLEPGDKLSGTAGEVGFGSQGGDIILGNIVEQEEGNYKRQRVPGLIVLLFFQCQQVVIAADDLKNSVSIGEKLHQLIGVVLG